MASVDDLAEAFPVDAGAMNRIAELAGVDASEVAEHVAESRRKLGRLSLLYFYLLWADSGPVETAAKPRPQDVVATHRLSWMGQSPFDFATARTVARARADHLFRRFAQEEGIDLEALDLDSVDDLYLVR